LVFGVLQLLNLLLELLPLRTQALLVADLFAFNFEAYLARSPSRAIAVLLVAEATDVRDPLPRSRLCSLQSGRQEHFLVAHVRTAEQAEVGVVVQVGVHRLGVLHIHVEGLHVDILALPRLPTPSQEPLSFQCFFCGLRLFGHLHVQSWNRENTTGSRAAVILFSSALLLGNVGTVAEVVLLASHLEALANYAVGLGLVALQLLLDLHLVLIGVEVLVVVKPRPELVLGHFGYSFFVHTRVSLHSRSLLVVQEHTGLGLHRLRIQILQVGGHFRRAIIPLSLLCHFSNSIVLRLEWTVDLFETQVVALEVAIDGHSVDLVGVALAVGVLDGRLAQVALLPR